MNKKSVEKLKDIGVSVLTVQYSYPDETFLKEVGFWNYDDFGQEIVFNLHGRVDSAKTARHIEQSLLLLVKAKRSGDPRVTEMLGELETLMNLIETDRKNTP